MMFLLLLSTFRSKEGAIKKKMSAIHKFFGFIYFTYYTAQKALSLAMFSKWDMPKLHGWI
jgi:hypothetical protein